MINFEINISVKSIIPASSGRKGELIDVFPVMSSLASCNFPPRQLSIASVKYCSRGIKNIHKKGKKGKERERRIEDIDGEEKEEQSRSCPCMPLLLTA